MNRVVVTGMGAVTPIGNDVESFWQGLVSGKCGIGPVTKFDTAEFKVKVAAEVKDFDPSRYMGTAELRHEAVFGPSALAGQQDTGFPAL